MIDYGSLLPDHVPLTEFLQCGGIPAGTESVVQCFIGDSGFLQLAYGRLEPCADSSSYPRLSEEDIPACLVYASPVFADLSASFTRDRIRVRPLNSGR